MKKAIFAAGKNVNFARNTNIQAVIAKAIPSIRFHKFSPLQMSVVFTNERTAVNFIRR